ENLCSDKKTLPPPHKQHLRQAGPQLPFRRHCLRLRASPGIGNPSVRRRPRGRRLHKSTHSTFLVAWVFRPMCAPSLSSTLQSPKNRKGKTACQPQVANESTPSSSAADKPASPSATTWPAAAFAS